MTLIAGLRCHDQFNQDAFVVAADSQETYDGQRAFLVKIEPRTMGNFNVTIGGSGYGDLVDAFTLRLNDTFAQSEAASVTEFRQIVESELLDFIKTEVRVFPVPRANKHLRFIIGARAFKSGECGCWITKHSRLKKIDKFEIIGCDEPLYRYLLGRLYSDELTIGQAVRLLIYLFSIAKKTSLYIDGPTSVSIATNNTLTMEDAPYIDEVEEQLREVGAATDELAIALPDAGLSAFDFDLKLREFAERVKAIRRKYLELAARREWEGLMNATPRKEEIYRKFPRGGSYLIEYFKGKLTNLTITDEPDQGKEIGCFKFDEFVCDDPRTGFAESVVWSEIGYSQKLCHVNVRPLIRQDRLAFRTHGFKL